MEDDLIFILMEDLQKNAILTNSTAQHRQPGQHNNQKYIGTNEKINLNWL
jgi:hypothetical protein